MKSTLWQTKYRGNLKNNNFLPEHLVMDSAIPLCEAAVQRFPNSKEAMAYLGRSLYLSNRYHESRITIETVAHGLPLAKTLLGIIYNRGYDLPQPDNQAALRYYREAALSGEANAQRNLAGFYLDGIEVEKSPPDAVRLLRAAVAKDNPAAKYLLGWLYINGLGVPDDPVMARTLFESAAQKEVVNAQFQLGLMVETGKTFHKDPAEAARWYAKAAQHGHTKAQYNLAQLYRNGNGVAQDYGKARMLYESAAKSGYTPALEALGDIYNNGYGITKDYSAANEWYERAALNNSPYALLHLGYMAQLGLGSPPNAALAAAYYERASDLGEVVAMLNLGALLEIGESIPQNLPKAASLYRKAADLGNTDAQLRVANMYYRNNYGVEHDPALGFEWLKKSALGGNVNSYSALGKAYFYGLGVQLDHGLALEWFLKSAKDGKADADTKALIGYQHLIGLGIPVDPVKALKWYIEAAEEGQVGAQYTLGQLYANGDGVKKDGMLALSWIKKSAEQNYGPALRTLGLMTMRGENIKEDILEGKRLLELAAAKDDFLALDELASLEDDAQNFNAAINFYQRSLALREANQGLYHLDLVSNLNELSRLNLVKNLATAKQYADRALEILSKNNVTEGGALRTSLAILGSVHLQLGDFDSSHSYLIRAQRLATSDANQHAMLDFLTSELSVWGQRKKQQEPSAEAVAKLHSASDKLLDAISKQSGGDDAGAWLTSYVTLFGKGDVEGAITIARRSLDATSSSTSTMVQFMNAVTVAQAALNKNSLDEAELYSEQALKNLFFSDVLTNSTLHANALGLIAKVKAAKGNLPAAIFFGKHSVRIIQKIRESFEKLDPAIQKTFADTNQYIYQDLAGWLIDSGRLYEAQEIIYLLKEKEDFDYYRSGPANRNVTATMVGVELDMSNRWEKEVASLLTLASRAERLDALMKQQRGLSQEDEQRRQAIRDELSAAYDRYVRTIYEINDTMLKSASKEALGSERLQEVAERNLRSVGTRRTMLEAIEKRGEVPLLLEYVITKEKLYILATRKDFPLSFVVDVPYSTIEKELSDFRQSLGDLHAEVKVPAEKLYRRLLAPVTALLKGTTLILLATDGPLRYIPFSALHDGERYMSERYAFSLYSHTANTDMASAAPKAWRLDGFGLVKEVARYDKLTAVRQELEEIKKFLPGPMPLYDSDFNKKNIRHALDIAKPGSVLHISSHFVFDPGSEDRSFLLLGDETSLKVTELFDMSFANVSLLTLSACATAVPGNRYRGIEVESFASRAQQRGARAIVATLWKVSDAGTAEFMQRFYRRRFKQGESLSNALRSTQSEFIKGEVHSLATRNWKHPYYWAPFVLMGNPL